MFGDLMTRCLLMLFGYAYPAFECYKTVVNHRVNVEELRFWCEYWIIVAILTILERIGDIFISWFPMYGEMKLALFIYLWYPKTKGTGYVFDMLLRPYVVKHEPDIEQKLKDWRLRAWDIALFYWKNCSELGQSAFLQVVHYLASQSSSPPPTNSVTTTQKKEQKDPPPPPPNDLPSFFRKPGKETSQSSKNNRWAPSAPPLPGAGIKINRDLTETQKSDVVKVHLDSQTGYVHVEDMEPQVPPQKQQSRFRRLTHR